MVDNMTDAEKVAALALDFGQKLLDELKKKVRLTEVPFQMYVT